MTEHAQMETETRDYTKTERWVALETFVDEDAGMFYEAGGIYDHEPPWKAGDGARLLEPGERVAVCPRCAQQFATIDESSAEENRDQHFDGDDDCPSICRNFAPRQLHLVERR